MTAVFALATSLLWGLADFGGGLLTRRIPALTVVVVSQTIAAVVRVTNVVVGGAALWVSVRRGAPALPEEGGMGVIRASLPALAFVGLADVAANGSYALAAQQGPVTVAAVLASLYPVITALAARGFLDERLRAVQAAGAGLALFGTVLLAAG
ncbi:EamA family transporter [Streptomyces sp. bgisy100]|uniref:EamA family transporter n=1 Tax=Streptomyces sp. bgisy100 TaxID=3413783 RepID=UPI003D7192FC